MIFAEKEATNELCNSTINAEQPCHVERQEAEKNATTTLLRTPISMDLHTENVIWQNIGDSTNSLDGKRSHTLTHTKNEEDWICANCGYEAKDVDAQHYYCLNCGEPRDQHTVKLHYYLENPALLAYVECKTHKQTAKNISLLPCVNWHRKTTITPEGTQTKRREP